MDVFLEDKLFQKAEEEAKAVQSKRVQAICIPTLLHSGRKGANEPVIPTETEICCIKNMSFIEKLMGLLSSKNHGDVITWFPEGKSFVILKPDQFTKEVLPQFFNETNFECFTHKLNCLGFKCMVGSPRNTAYYHDVFLRDQPELCKQMQRYNIAVHDHDVNKQEKIVMVIALDVSDDETTTSKVSVGLDKAIVTTVTNPEVIENRKVSQPAITSQDIKGSLRSLDLINRPWVDVAFPFPCDKTAIFHEKFNINSIMNLKPIMVRPEVTKKSLNFISIGLV